MALASRKFYPREERTVRGPKALRSQPGSRDSRRSCGASSGSFVQKRRMDPERAAYKAEVGHRAAFPLGSRLRAAVYAGAPP